MSLANQFKGLPMEDLIGGPLVAAVNAQGKMAMQTAEFINDVGINKDTGELNTVGFSYKKTEKDENNNEKESVKTIAVPVLAMVNIPSLKVKKVDINFEMEVKQQTETKSSIEAKTEFSVKYKSTFSPVSASISGSVSGKRENARKTDNSAKYTVNVVAEDEGMPEGLSRVLTMLSNIIVEKDGKDKKDDVEEI